MRTALTIALREYRSLFRLPVGWVVIALYLALAGFVFAFLTLIPGEVGSMRLFFGFSGWLLLPVAPAISMRLLSEEYRGGTIETLVTSPASDASIVLGKYLGAASFLATMILPTIVHVVVLHRVTEPTPDPGPILAGYLALVLLGMLYLAIGTFATSLTSNQTLAFLSTLFLLLGLMTLATIPLGGLPTWVQDAVGAISIQSRLGSFAKGVVDLGHVVFFLVASAWFLLLALLVLEGRRWR